jgi:hypothetical protein
LKQPEPCMHYVTLSTLLLPLASTPGRRSVLVLVAVHCPLVCILSGGGVSNGPTLSCEAPTGERSTVGPEGMRGTR